MKQVNMYQVVGTNIKKYRELANISVLELSELSGINKNYLIEYENNPKKEISIKELYIISKILNVKIEDFFK